MLEDGEKQSLWVRNVATKSDVQVLPSDGSIFDGLNYSPDGNYVYYTRAISSANIPDLYVMPVLGGASRLFLPRVIRPISFSPDGKQIAYLRLPTDGPIQVRIINADGTADRSIASLDVVPFIYGTSWSPDGKMIAVSAIQVAKHTEIKWLVNVFQASDGATKTLYTSGSDVGQAVWTTDGDSLLVPIESEQGNHRQLWTIAYPGGELRRVTNDLANYGSYLDMTRDGRTIATTESTTSSHIWEVPQGQTALAKQITFQETPDTGVAAGPGGKILINSGIFNVLLMDADGSHRTPLMPQTHNVGTFSSCGDKYVVLDSLVDKKAKLWRVEPDGSNATVLAEDAVFPNCSRDGKFLVYSNTEGTKFYRMPVEGGAPAELNIPPSFGAPILRISPDGNWLAYLYQEFTVGARERIAIVSSNGGTPAHLFPLPEDTNSFMWSPDSNAVQFVLKRGGAANIWEQPLSGGPRRQITNFTSGLIFDFAWSRDGKQLYLAKGESNSDVILMTNFR